MGNYNLAYWIRVISLNRKIYRQVARKYGVTVSEVKRDMQAAIAAACQNPTAAATDVPRKGDVPTPDELISHIARKVRTDR